MAKTVLVLLQQRDGQLHRTAKEVAAAGLELASSIGASAEGILLGSNLGAAAEAASTLGLAALHVADHPALGSYTPGAYIGALASRLRAVPPAFVVFAHTYQSVDFVAKLAQAVSAGYLPEVTGFRAEEGGLVFRRPVLGGKLEARVRTRGEGCVFLTVQSGAFQPAPGSAATATTVTPWELVAENVRVDRELLGVESAAAEKIDLTKATAIVAAGRGVGGADKLGPILDLAKALGAEIAASRPVIDNGWLERDRQIGSSGQTVSPRLYVAAGISGAIQHTVGMKGSQVIVAINKDASAPIFKIAQYGIVGDLHEIVPELTAAVREASGS